ncbi:protocadherin gamma-A4-like isoform X16 [Polyodon spathula]|uniref:protocadherin gamma-A4-like isoform X16 n=1 Tax=Polyodon spathula TaxID=7913 RepID=UPI001B7F4CBC|nr:protocadherin gamma-A4-like isoform X16 [Polyodon spathula]
MILQTSLDREKQDELSLILTAFDGGSPQRSGTVIINIIVLDANDNAPVFSQAVYKAEVFENALKGDIILTVTATDVDKGSYGYVTYSFTHVAERVGELFDLNPNNGEITVAGDIDYEKAKLYQMNVQAKDHGGLTDSTKIMIAIIDVNDNVPIITIMSFSSPIPEDSKPGTAVAMVNVQDLDSGNNGKVTCVINKHIPFEIKSSLTNYYSLVTENILDSEKISEYNITIIAIDEGSPPLSSSQNITLKISDVNDNAPTFNHALYTAHVSENNSPGVSIFSVQARDADSNQNALIVYFLEEDTFNGTPVSSYISINSDSGILYAVRSFDYEQIREFQIHVKAQDGGSPPLSSNVTVNIFVQDKNDNAPQILYPVQTEGSLVAEMVPRSADVGYLVTKVVAVDADSGQNAWLSYKLHKATDWTLFEVGLQNGEIRTLRQVVDKDAMKQRLVVLVEDNGQPSSSATVNVNVAVADSFPEVLSEFSDSAQDKDYNENLTFYLVVSLATVSFLFIVSIIIILSLKFCNWRQSRLFYKSNGNLPVIPSSYYPPQYADVGGNGTLRHVYNYEVCLTTDSGKSEFRYIRPGSQSLVCVDPSGTETMLHSQKEKNVTQDTDIYTQQKPANTEWRFSQGQRPGPSGSQRPEEAGPWPNPPTEAEQLQALMAAANEVSAATATLDAGTMGLSTRYSPQFTLQHVPDYRQNVYIPGSTSTLTGTNSQPEGKNPQPSSGNKKKSGKKEKK